MHHDPCIRPRTLPGLSLRVSAGQTMPITTPTRLVHRSTTQRVKLRWPCTPEMQLQGDQPTSVPCGRSRVTGGQRSGATSTRCDAEEGRCIELMFDCDMCVR